MLKTCGVTIGILVSAVLALTIVSPARGEIHWRSVSQNDETANYESYVTTWPDGRHTAEAQKLHEEHGWVNAQATDTVQWYERYAQLHGEGKHVAEAEDNIESLHWREATDANTVQGYERYIQLHGEGKHVAEAKDNIESLHWREATDANTIKSYQRYVTAHPQGRHVQEARTKAAALSIDDTPFEAAMNAGTEGSLKQFLEDFPGHRKQSDIQQTIREITEGRDIYDLLRETIIVIEILGSGIDNVTVRIRKLVPQPITVRVPVGSYFVSSSQSVQNMVATADIKISLPNDEWSKVLVPAACANRVKNIPHSKNTFTIQQSPHQADLARLMPVLDKALVPYPVRQAAVWIVTDNADYGALGILVRRSPLQLSGGIRQINEYEAAMAMKICDEAGIDITSKAIWHDRQRILSGIKNEDLKKWLEYKE